MKGPLSGNLLLWQLKHRKILTLMTLQRRGLPVNTICPICKQADETIEHTFRDCKWIKRVLCDIIPACLQREFFDQRSRDVWVDWCLKQPPQHRLGARICKYQFREGVKMVWFWRNAIYHGNQEAIPPKHLLTARIKKETEGILKILEKERGR